MPSVGARLSIHPNFQTNYSDNKLYQFLIEGDFDGVIRLVEDL